MTDNFAGQTECDAPRGADAALMVAAPHLRAVFA